METYYNPKTRPDAAHTRLGEPVEILPGSARYDLYGKRAYNSKQEALNAGVSGQVFWFEGKRLFSASSRGAFEFKPLQMEPSFAHGINWCDAYFFTKQAAEDWASKCGCRYDRPQYSEECDVYSVHFHWIDNPDCMRWHPGEPLTPEEVSASDKSGGVKKMSLK